MNLSSADGTTLSGWYLEHPSPRFQLLFFHGNGEHLGYLAGELDFLRTRLQASVFAIDYRGYGQSVGKPGQEGVLADGLAAQTWLAHRAGIHPEQVVLFGRSLGGAVAVHNAATLGARGLILERTFDSLVNVAAHTVRFLPVRWLMRNRFPSIDHIGNYHGPLLQLHGAADTIVPMENGRRLFEASPSKPKTWLQEEALGHNAPRPSRHIQAIADFLDSLP